MSPCSSTLARQVGLKTHLYEERIETAQRPGGHQRVSGLKTHLYEERIETVRISRSE